MVLLQYNTGTGTGTIPTDLDKVEQILGLGDHVEILLGRGDDGDDNLVAD